MKKILQFSAILMAPLLAKAQTANGIEFNFYYKPESNYHFDITKESTIKMSELPKVNKKTKGQTSQEPMVKEDVSQVSMNLITGLSENGQDYPLSMVIQSEQNPVLAKGITFYGHGSINDLPKLESVSAPDLNEAQKEMMLKMLQAVFAQVKYPKKQVKIGESIEMNNAINLPIAGMEIQMDIKGNMKLLNVVDHIAEFDMDQTFVMKMPNIKGVKMTGSGSGSGKIYYDVFNNYFTKEDLNMGMKMYLSEKKTSLLLEMNNHELKINKMTKNTPQHQ